LHALQHAAFSQLCNHAHIKQINHNLLTGLLAPSKGKLASTAGQYHISFPAVEPVALRTLHGTPRKFRAPLA